MTAALKYVPASICNSQLAAIDAVREIFSNGTIKPSKNKTSQAPLMEKQAKPERYRLPTSKDDRVNKPATTYKGVLRETVHTVPKIKYIKINAVDDQEPISRRTRSSKGTKTLKIIQKTSDQFHKRPDQKLVSKNIQHPPTQGNLPQIC